MKRERDDDLPIKQESDTSVTTAVDYVKQQDELEKQARELMPYDPNECTFNKGELRQPIFACLTCSRQNDNSPIGVCYSCSIQCHSSHDLVELFSKREFVCDCGTTRMSKTLNGACKLRIRTSGSGSGSVSGSSGSGTFRPRTGSSSSGHGSWGSQSNLDLPADDIPGSNSYNHNFKGLFCSCKEVYNPLEETGNMLQCYFGFECGEDWFHEDCILGYKHGLFKKNPTAKPGVNLLDELPEPEEDALNDTSITSDRHDEDDPVPFFPSLESFDVFICWKCASKFAAIFQDLEKEQGIVFECLPHFNDVQSAEEWGKLYKQSKSHDEQDTKRIKLENQETVSTTTYPKSYFLNFFFRDKLKVLLQQTQSEKLKNFLKNYEYIYMSDPVYEPPEEDDSSSTSGSILELGAEALSNVPREQALKGIEAYDKIKSKLRDFFKPFAEEGKVVTEEEVRAFFGNVKKEGQ